MALVGKVPKRIALDISRLPDGNAFALMNVFARRARREGWTQKEIDLVVQEARSGDHHHLIATLEAHSIGGGYSTEDA